MMAVTLRDLIQIMEFHLAAVTSATGSAHCDNMLLPQNYPTHFSVSFKVQAVNDLDNDDDDEAPQLSYFLQREQVHWSLMPPVLVVILFV